MRIARVAAGGRPMLVQIEGEHGDEVFFPLTGDVLAGDVRPQRHQVMRLADVRMLVPVEPSKIVAVGRNYADHAAELAHEVSERPRVFLKPPSSLLAHGEAIRCPPQSREVHHEAELAVVIGRPCRNIRPERAVHYIAGYTCANDVTARDIQQAEGLPSYAKSFDTFCPLGPWIETDLEPGRTRIVCTVNGERRQDDHTHNMLWSVPDLVAHVAAAMTLLPGDVLLTGTPAGASTINPGDTVAVTIDGVGTLSNPVIPATQG